MSAEDLILTLKVSLADKVLIQHALGEYLHELKKKDRKVVLDQPEVVHELLERLKRNGTP